MAVPPLEAKLVNIASINPNVARTILEGIGRRIKAGDVQKLQAIFEFLERGGSPKALGVLLGYSDLFTTISASEAILRLPTLQPGDFAAIDAIIELLGTGSRATDVLIGISRYGDGAGRSGVYTAIRDLIPATNSGLPQVVRGLAYWDSSQN